MIIVKLVLKIFIYFYYSNVIFINLIDKKLSLGETLSLLFQLVTKSIKIIQCIVATSFLVLIFPFQSRAQQWL